MLHQTAELVSHRLGPYTRQGSAVAMSADASTLAVAGTTWTERRPSAVTIYERSGDRWVRQTTLKSPPVDFGTVTDNWASDIAISSDGDTLALTDPTRLVKRTRAMGLVHLFTRFGQTRRATGRLLPPQSASWFGLGLSLSADGIRALMGSYGRAYVADTRTEVVRELRQPAEADSLGGSVAISPDGRTVVLGAPQGITDARPGVGGSHRPRRRPGQGLDPALAPRGAAGREGQLLRCCRRRHPSGRRRRAVPRPGGVGVRPPRHSPRAHRPVRPQSHRQAFSLGENVAVSADGSTVVSGAPYRNAAGGSVLSAGAAYRWVRTRGGWVWGGLLSVAHPHPGEYQGYSTAFSADGRVVVLGAPGRTSARLSESGAAIVFDAVP